MHATIIYSIPQTKSYILLNFYVDVGPAVSQDALHVRKWL